MSNHLAVATVTAALGETIQEALDRDVTGAKVQVGRPDAALGQNGHTVVTLFLYQVTPNAAYRNTNLPYRGSSAVPIARPMVALDLHYLLSFYGDAATFEPERLLGATVRALEERPLLQRAILEKVIQNNPEELGEADLHQAPNLVRAQPASLSLEEMSKLWSVFFQVPYALSVAYQCTCVMVEADVEPRQPLPVSRPSLTLFPLTGPRIEAIEAVEGATFPIVWGGTVRIRGQRLGMSELALRVGTTDVVMDETTFRDGAIEMPLDAATFGGVELPAGIHAVRTVLPPPAGAPSHLERTSDSAPMVLRPTLTVAADAVNLVAPQAGQPRNGSLKVSFSPVVGAGQTVKAFLDERTTESPRSYVLEHADEAALPSATLTFLFNEVVSGTYLLRAQVDGVESAPTLGTDPDADDYRHIIGPEVTIA